MNYDVDYFIRKFTRISENKWICGELNADGASCALGFCGVKDYEYNHEAVALGNILKPLIDKDCNPYEVVYSINDGLSFEDNRTPKQRILDALHEIKKMHDCQATPVTEVQPPVKVITKYVGVPESILENNQIVLS